MAKQKSRDGSRGSHGGRGNEIDTVAQVIWDKARGANKKPNGSCTVPCRKLLPHQQTVLRGNSAQVVEAVKKIAEKQGFSAHLNDGDVKIVVKQTAAAAR